VNVWESARTAPSCQNAILGRGDLSSDSLFARDRVACCQTSSVWLAEGIGTERGRREQRAPPSQRFLRGLGDLGGFLPLPLLLDYFALLFGTMAESPLNPLDPLSASIREGELGWDVFSGTAAHHLQTVAFSRLIRDAVRRIGTTQAPFDPHEAHLHRDLPFVESQPSKSFISASAGPSVPAPSKPSQLAGFSSSSS
jgi:hypothetical protein